VINSQNNNTPADKRKGLERDNQGPANQLRTAEDALSWAIDRIVKNPNISEPFRRGMLVAASRRANG
jgi:hypothetical protein